ncbi:prepilin-type N-terminal cleavage/methylation domain-containing protein [bacterium]|nr:prepilin-type N-terminal cleavage/methylation domain-containing protein [bacterium]
MRGSPCIPLSRQSRQPRGFTLIELLVAVSILLLLTVITLLSVNFALTSDRVKGGARQVQSYLAGARDRAIYSRQPYGVRLLLDPNNPHQATGMIYIGSPELFTDGQVTFDSSLTGDVTGRVVMLAGSTDWVTWAGRGLVGPGSRVEIPRYSGNWYRFASTPITSGSHSLVVLDHPCADLAGSSVRVKYALELAPGVLPGAEPVSLPAGVVIDLDGSKLPSAWTPSSFTGSYSGLMDILFSARGVAIGDVAAVGQIHLLIADQGDSDKWTQITGRNSGTYNPPFVPANNPNTPDTLTVENDQILVSVAALTGRVTSHPVNVTNTTAPANLQADDPYLFAEVGEVATP